MKIRYILHKIVVKIVFYLRYKMFKSYWLFFLTNLLSVSPGVWRGITISIAVWGISSSITISPTVSGITVSTIPGFWLSFGFSIGGSLAEEMSVCAVCGGIRVSVGSSAVGGQMWVSKAIGGSVWVSGISVVSISQPWFSFSFGISISRSLAEVVTVSGSITVVSESIDSGVWVSSMSIGGSVWVSSISVVSISQPWFR